jgi:hypothetical protein
MLLSNASVSNQPGAAVKHLTVRNVPADVARALEREKVRRTASLNETVIELLRRALGLGEAERSNGLARLAGGWSAEDLQRFETAVAGFGRIDPELWQ